MMRFAFRSACPSSEQHSLLASSLTYGRFLKGTARDGRNSREQAAGSINGYRLSALSLVWPAPLPEVEAVCHANDGPHHTEVDTRWLFGTDTENTST